MKFVAYIFLVGLQLLVKDARSDFDSWAADLKPGMVITSFQKDGEMCHCKVPENSSTAPPIIITTTIIIPTSTVMTTVPTATTPTTTAPTTTTSTPTTTTPTTTTPTTTTPTTTTPTTTTPTTTTPTTTTPTTTTPTTTTPTTTTPTTTTPTTTTTTTTTTPTTTNPPTTVNYDYCNVDLELTPTTSMHWKSPNYPANYPDGITCTLTVTIPKSMPFTLVTLTPSENSYIYSEHKNGNDCPNDRIEHTSPGAKAYYCQSLQEIGEVAIMDVPYTFSLKFVSTPADGGHTATGFDYLIKAESMFG